MITVDSLTFDLTDCTLKQEGPGMKGWMRSDHIAHVARLYPAPSERPFNWPFDLTDANAAAEFYDRQCKENHGAMLSMDVVSAGGAESLRGLFKYRAPIPGSLAMFFVGILYVPFQTCCFQVNVEAMETGATGMREAAVMVMEQPNPPKDGPEPVLLKDGEDLFDHLRATPLSKLSADDALWDESFPEHPLSKVRARLKKVIDTLELSPELQALPPFRLSNVSSQNRTDGTRKAWQFWKR